MGLHLIAILLLQTGIYEPGLTEPGIDSHSERMTFISIDPESEAATEPSHQPDAEKATFDIPEPALSHEDFATEEPQLHSLPTARFVPPRLLETSEGTLSLFGASVRLDADKSARIVVSIEVLAEGVAGEVKIESTSGNPEADAAAVAYAKSLRWQPATAGGMPIAFRVSMPVVFTGLRP